MQTAYTDQYTAWKIVHYPRKLCWQGMGELIYSPPSTLQIKVIKGDDAEDSRRDKIKNTLSGMHTAKERTQWKRDEKCSRIAAALDRRVVIQTDLRDTIAPRSAPTGEERYLALGSGSAYVAQQG